MSLSRRSFLELAGMSTAGIAVPLPLPGLLGLDPANVRKVKRQKTLVLLFLRGGADGLNLVTPYGEKAYYDYRRSIALPPPKSAVAAAQKLRDLDGFFGLHPRLSDLLPFWKSKDLSIVHAVGNPKNNRSHFVQQDIFETADPTASVQSEGFLNRHLQTSEGRGPLRAVSIGARLPRVLRGSASAVAIRSVRDLAYQNRYGDPDQIADALEELYGKDQMPQKKKKQKATGRGVVEAAGRSTMAGLRALEDIGRAKYTPAKNAKYPANNSLGVALANVAQLIKADVGLEVVEIDYGGWDTHRNQGQAAGAFGARAGAVGGAMAAFARDLGDRLQDVLVLTVSEFGRTARENGTAGTDHGHGGVMFVLGGALRQGSGGGKVVGKWPGLAAAKLNQRRDLAVTTDFRDVYAEVLRHHLGNHNLDTILSGHKPKQVGLLHRRSGRRL
ncbi:MAG: DUF1501 domain-containing protein [Planctomycetota bacterium]|jgi:uncharacterized protein (DUF1501 family)